MSAPRDRRRIALQVLYQLDNTTAASIDEIDRQSLGEALDVDPPAEDAIAAGLALADGVWAHCREADAAIEPLTPEWPPRRQPVVDRNLLRLAWYEMTVARVPPKVVMSEAIELAREFSTAESPSFINGVLDRLFHTPPASSEDGTLASHPES